MDEPLLRVALFVAVTNGFRALGLVTGPRWGGLLLGLPCTSALTLYVYGSQCGVNPAVRAAGSGLLGVVAAVAFSLAYTQVISAGWTLPCGVAASVLGYFAVAWGLGGIRPVHPGWSVVLAVLAVIGTRRVMARSRREAVAHAREPLTGLRSGVRSWVLRTVVPALCPLVVMACKERLGADWAGLLITFPGMSLAVLVLIYLERGPAVAIRMSRALPLGNLSMIAFLAAFCAASPRYGLAWGTAGAYAAALIALPVVAGLTRRPEYHRSMAATAAGAPTVAGLARFDRSRILGAWGVPGRSWGGAGRPAPARARRRSPGADGRRGWARPAAVPRRRHRRFAPRIEAVA